VRLDTDHFNHSSRIPSLGMDRLKPEDGVRHRIMAHEPVSDDANFLMTGGEAQYLDYCPEHGCAVILKRDEASFMPIS